MEVTVIDPPRVFEVGKRGGEIAHCADVRLGPDEQVTFITEAGSEHDVVRKSWGYYATASLNGRLREHGLRAALCQGIPRDGESAFRMYLMLVDPTFEDDFSRYLEAEEMRVVAWLDSDDAVAEAARRLSDAR